MYGAYGTVLILHLVANGVVKSVDSISGNLAENFGITLANAAQFGETVDSFDLNGDGITDITVGAPADGVFGRVYGVILDKTRVNSTTSFYAKDILRITPPSQLVEGMVFGEAIATMDNSTILIGSLSNGFWLLDL